MVCGTPYFEMTPACTNPPTWALIAFSGAPPWPGSRGRPAPRDVRPISRPACLPFPASSLTYVRPESVSVESLSHLLGARRSSDDRPEANIGIALDRDRHDRRSDAVRLGADSFLDLALDQRRLEQFAHGPD